MISFDKIKTQLIRRERQPLLNISKESTLRATSASLIDLAGAVKVVSSANILVDEYCKQLGKSFYKSRKEVAP